ncbi:MAG TPA: MASE1 domain-containing protein [bacterium]|nr:MASE1 domain-containing protein [bacterium]
MASIYFVAAKLGLKLAYFHPSATPVWPPTGIALATLLLIGYRAWPGIFLGAFLANLTTAGTVWTSLGIATGNTLEGLVGAYLVRRYSNGSNTFDRPPDIFKYVVFAAVVGPIVSATIGVTSLSLAGFAPWAEYRPIWLTWWLGDASGALIVAPLIVLWSNHPDLRWDTKAALERALFLVTLLTVSWIVFSGMFPFEYLTVPFLVWAAFRFDQRETATVIALLASLAVWGTIKHLGPFVGATPNESLLLLQAFMGILVLVALPLAGVVAERETASKAAKHRSEASFRLMFAGNPLPMWVYDSQTLRFLEVNDAAIALYGYSRDEFLDMRITDIRPSEEVSRLQRYVSKERPRLRHAGEWRHRTKDGQLIYVEISSHDLQFADHPAVLVVAKDVSDRRRSEDARRESEERFRELFENANDLVYTSDLEGRFTSVNEAAERVTGYTRDELLAMGTPQLLAPEYLEPVRQQGQQKMAKGRATSFTIEIVAKDGRRVPLEVSTRLMYRQGSPMGIQGIARDVTDRRQAEQEIRRRAAHLETFNAIITSAFSASDLSTLLETTVDLTLRALGGEMGGIWAGSAHVVRGMPSEVGPAIQRAAEVAGHAVRGPEAADDWQSATPPAANALATVMGQFGIRASIVAPIQTEGRVIGGIAVTSARPRTWLPEEVMLVETVGKQIAGAVERLQLAQMTQRRALELETFYDLSRRLRAARGVDEMYPMIVEHAMHLLASEHGSLALLNADRASFTRVYTVGVSEEKSGSTFPVEGTRSGRVVQTGVTFVTKDFRRESVPAWMDASHYAGYGPLIIVLLRSEEEIIGTLTLARRTTHAPFTEEEVHLLEGIAELAGTAIRRARLHDHLEQSYLEMVLALARAVDARDSYTADHSERIATRAVAIARTLGCPVIEVQDIHWGALLHDIGKLSVPDNILRKPGPLTDAEWDIMRQHPVVGEGILRSVERMRNVATLVRHHQERWDGTGYPDRLYGDEIPLGARILAVADAYSAITDDRAYSKGRSLEEAITEIRRCAGTQFDPRVVEAFCRVAKVERIDVLALNDQGLHPIGSALESLATGIVRPFAQTRQFRQLVPAMVDVAKRLLRPLDLTAVLDEILGQIQEVFGYPICAILFIDAQSRELNFKAQRGYDPDVAKTMRLRIGEQGIAGWVARHGRAYYAPDVRQDSLYVSGSPAARSNAAYPLVVDDQVIGVLDVESPIVDAFPKEVRELLEAFAALAALAILRAQRDEDLNRLALTDGLTGLANHRALWDALEREVARAMRGARPVSVVIVEIDKFKQINDFFGHLEGDTILRTVADVLKKNSRAMDLPARFGGDELVLLLPDVAKKAAVQIAERVRHYVEEIPIGGGTRLTVSVGLASLPEDGETAKALIEAADHAMYEAKHGGGNRVHVA